MSQSAGEILRVAVLDDYQAVALTSANWQPVKARAEVQVFTDTLLDQDDLVERLKDFHIICTMRERTKILPSLIDRLPNLRLITTTGMRNASIDSVYARERGIVVSGTGGQGNSTLEHIWALILAAARFIVVEDRNVKSGLPRWQSTVPLGLAGRTLGLVGVGRLGSQVATIAHAFNMRVAGWSPHFTPERALAAGVEFVETKEELLRTSDIVSIHLVLSHSTTHTIQAHDLAVMKRSALLVNTSRGPIVDEEALIKALQDGQIAGAALDVFDVEPLPLDHPLRKLENVTLSPHLGYVNDANYQAFWEQTVENIAAFLDGKPQRQL